MVAGGSGSRYGGDVPKQFTDLLGVKVIDRAIALFRGVAQHIIAVVPGSSEWWTPPGDVHQVTGGLRRQDSVMNGLKAAAGLGATHVLVHDGARPWVDPSCLERVMEKTISAGACLPCVPVRETVKRVINGYVTETVDRSELELAQTPQGFRLDMLIEAMGKAGDVTDEASAVEALGIPVASVPGSRRNVKLTDREDGILLERVLSPSATSLGTGLDFHPFSPDRPLILCGCRLGENHGLSGHSDGDVVLHAVADAILAGSRSGDIGTLFPPEDMKWKNADSALLLRECGERALRKGWAVKSLDVTVIGERPRIAPLREMFITRLSEILSISRGSIWIKGTTTNSIGELARGKGLGCHALVVLAGVPF